MEGRILQPLKNTDKKYNSHEFVKQVPTDGKGGKRGRGVSKKLHTSKERGGAEKEGERDGR